MSDLRSSLERCREEVARVAHDVFIDGGFSADYPQRFLAMYDAFSAASNTGTNMVNAGWATGVESAYWLAQQGVTPPRSSNLSDFVRARMLMVEVPRIVDQGVRVLYYESVGQWLIGYMRGISSYEVLNEYEYLGSISRQLIQAPDAARVQKIACDASVALVRADAACVSLRSETGVWRTVEQRGLTEEILCSDTPDSALERVEDLLRGETLRYDDLINAGGMLHEIGVKFGVHSSISVPLMAEGNCIGALTAVRRSPSPFSERDAAVMHVLGLQVVANLTEKRSVDELRDAYDALKGSERKFRELTDAIPQMVWTAGADGAMKFYNQRWYEYTGIEAPMTQEDDWTRVVPFEQTHEVQTRLKQSLESGEPLELEHRLWHAASKRYRWVQMRALPRRDSSGRIVEWIGTMIDIHNQKQARETQQFFADAGKNIVESLEIGTTLATIASLAVPHYADWCQIDLLDDKSVIRTAAITHFETQRNVLAQDLVGQQHFDSNALVGVPSVMRTGRSEVFEEIEPDQERTAVLEPWAREIYRRLGFRSAIVVPIVAHAKTIGTMTFVYGDSDRRYVPEDLSLTEELGRRSGLAIENARLFEREHRVASSFQEASLPAQLPNVAGLVFDAVYVPAEADAQVGGDWYDAMRLLDGRIVISIGDVAGNGLNAAVTMGNVRQIIRGIAQVHADPALMLDAADRALRLENPNRFVTAFVGVLDQVAGTLTYASAGHPPPYLRAPDGSVTRLAQRGLPLVLREGREGASEVVAVAPGSLLVLYTDGLTEYLRDPVEGERRLESLLRGDQIAHQEKSATALIRHLLNGHAPHDDVAILTIAIGDVAAIRPSTQRRWHFDAHAPGPAQRARREFGEILNARGVSEDDAGAAQVVFGELVGNVTRYGGDEVEAILEWGAALPVLHVLDRGPGFRHLAILPADIYAESGRGLFIVSALTEDFHVSKRPGGGSHARAVLIIDTGRLVPSKNHVRTRSLFDALVRDL